MMKMGGLFSRRVANNRELELRSSDHVHVPSSDLPIEDKSTSGKDNQHSQGSQNRASESNIASCEPFSLLVAYKRLPRKVFSRERDNTPHSSAKDLFEHDKDQSEVSGLSNDDSSSSILEVTREVDLGHAVPFLRELKTDVYPVPPSEQDVSLTPWIIQVLDSDEDDNEDSKSQEYNDGNSLWFRIYFQPEQDYVYYKGEEIINYVRDLLEFHGRSVFQLQHMSAKEAIAVLGANEVLGKLREVIDRPNTCE